MTQDPKIRFTISRSSKEMHFDSSSLQRCFCYVISTEDDCDTRITMKSQKTKIQENLFNVCQKIHLQCFELKR